METKKFKVGDILTWNHINKNNSINDFLTVEVYSIIRDNKYPFYAYQITVLNDDGGEKIPVWERELQPIVATKIHYEKAQDLGLSDYYSLDSLLIINEYGIKETKNHLPLYLHEIFSELRLIISSEQKKAIALNV